MPAKLSRIWDHLALTADLPRAEIPSFVRALCDAELVPHGRDAEATPEAVAWMILAMLCGPEPKRAVERAQEVANFCNYSPAAITFTDGNGTTYRRPFVLAQPELTFSAALETIFRAQAGKSEPALPLVMISDVSGYQCAAIAYQMREPPTEVPEHGPGCSAPVWEAHFTPALQGLADVGKLQHAAAITPEALAGITRLLGFEPEQARLAITNGAAANWQMAATAPTYH